MTRAIPLEQAQHDPSSVVTVGTFDGVHAGHQTLLRYVARRARERGGRSVAVTFDPHPREVVHGHAIHLLSTVDERAEAMTAAGIDVLLVVRFTSEFARMSAADFVSKTLVGKVGMQEIVIGYDFTFGRGREGDSRLLMRLGREHGFNVDVVPAQIMGERVVSSSEIRQLLTERGDVTAAANLLTRRYGLEAVVVHGDGRGRQIGYPTANLQPVDSRKVVPRQGVYAVRVNSEGADMWRGGMMNIGRRPTFGEDDVHLEVYVFDFEGDLYGRLMKVEFVERVRDEERFHSVDALIEQLASDERRCRELLGELS